MIFRKHVLKLVKLGESRLIDGFVIYSLAILADYVINDRFTFNISFIAEKSKLFTRMFRTLKEWSCLNLVSKL